MLQQMSCQHHYLRPNPQCSSAKKQPGRLARARPAFLQVAKAAWLDYDSHVQSQPSAQFSQQPLSQPQSGQPSQQPLSLQQPAEQVGAAGVEAVNAIALVAKAPTAANVQNDFVNMVKLTFWLM